MQWILALSYHVMMILSPVWDIARPFSMTASLLWNMHLNIEINVWINIVLLILSCCWPYGLGNLIHRDRADRSVEALRKHCWKMRKISPLMRHWQHQLECWFFNFFQEVIPKERTLPTLMATTNPETSSCGMKLHILGWVKNKCLR